MVIFSSRRTDMQRTCSSVHTALRNSIGGNGAFAALAVESGETRLDSSGVSEALLIASPFLEDGLHVAQGKIDSTSKPRVFAHIGNVQQIQRNAGHMFFLKG